MHDVDGMGVQGGAPAVSAGCGAQPRGENVGFQRKFYDILRCFHWIGPWMLVGPMGVPHVCTIILGGYFPVRLVGDIAYSNHCGDS